MKHKILKIITFTKPSVSVFGALHCMSCSGCLSAKICTCRYTCCIRAQVAYWCNKRAFRILGQSVTGPTSTDDPLAQNGDMFPKAWPGSAGCLGISRAECRAGERLAEWHVLRGGHSAGAAQEPDKHGRRVGPSDFLVGRMELCPSDEFGDRDFDLRDYGIHHCY